MRLLEPVADTACAGHATDALGLGGRAGAVEEGVGRARRARRGVVAVGKRARLARHALQARGLPVRVRVAEARHARAGVHARRARRLPFPLISE